MTASISQTGIPNLGGVITPADVSPKGTGNDARLYVNWAKIAHLLHVHAPGWQFALRRTSAGDHIWAAPDGSGYVVGYFTNGHQQTPDFPQACMDNRNNPIPAERITARVLTDTHRRCLCTAAAFTFGLAYELWAKVEVENPMRDDDAAPVVASASKPASKAPQKKAAATLTSDQVQELVHAVLKVSDEQRSSIIKAFQQRFDLPADKKAADYIKTTEHRDFLMQQIHAVQTPATA
ncbi:MAG: hypothetical protein ACO289_10140 [Prochlorococcaceae cyanobacterium]